MKPIKILLLFFFFCSSVFAQKDSTRVLIITAHPDDESGMAATVYKITHELHGAVDLAVLTNGEAGYKYSLLAEPIYGVKLTDEATGRKYLPTIRKKELMAAGAVIGITNFYFLDQQDNHYTLDVDTIFREVWDTAWVKQRLKKIIVTGNYDFIFCLLPAPETHGHHKGATILALGSVSSLPAIQRPTIFGVSVSSKEDTNATRFTMLDKFPLTSVKSGKWEYSVDRTSSFGFKNALNYKIIVNWEIAEHKSQGSMQTYMGKGDFEHFWNFDLNDTLRQKKSAEFFRELNNIHP